MTLPGLDIATVTDLDNRTSSTAIPPPPVEPELAPRDPRTNLVTRVRAALAVLSGFFEFGTTIEGIDATDLFSLNAVLGTSIEVQVVRTLNRMRDIWDPEDEFVGYRFERQAQTFPDVRLVRRGPRDVEIALGIELKGWYLLSKEGAPSLRFTTTAAACSEFDLIAVVPWHLSNLLSGTPVAIEPWVTSARFAAEFRNHWWQHVRRSSDARAIAQPAAAHPYPSKDTLIADIPTRDGGDNFGRLARVAGLMDDFIGRAKQHPALGIPIHDWILFLRRYSDNRDAAEITTALQRDLDRTGAAATHRAAQQAIGHLRALTDLLAPTGRT